MHKDDDEAFADNYAERDQAKALREQARAGGLRFEAYLPGELADWLLQRVEGGMFVDPSEAVFAIVKNFIEMEPHRDLRDELLRRILDASLKSGLEDVEAGRTRPADEVFDELRRKMAEPRPEPARWAKIAR
ncbi:CopG family transcriptional regulator (plasmid) [Sphingobium limneticum]|jgi:antitoxin ParD1/3/4